MSRPDDIPQWAWEKALFTLNEVDAFSEFYSSEQDQRIHIAAARAILSAVEEEREACALVAQRYAHPNPFPTVYRAIADAIRSRKESQP